MHELIERHQKKIKDLRRYIDKLYSMRFLEDDALHNALEHVFDEIDYNLTILMVLQLAHRKQIKPIKGVRKYRVRLKCDPGGCSKCQHRSCGK